jgi:hypothetical protein
MALDREHFVDLANGRFGDTTAADLEGLFRAFSQDANKDRLVVHFHGGLVNQAAGRAIAERLLPLYEDATGYPVLQRARFAGPGSRSRRARQARRDHRPV